MKLEVALKGMFEAENQLRSSQGVNNPSFMSEQMARLSQYTGAVEEHLALAEEEEEIVEAQAYKKAIAEGKSPSAAETVARFTVAEYKGNIKRLTRLTSSAWRQVGVIQSRINHLTREAQTGV